MDYTQEFKAAKAANDWDRLEVIWQALCIEAEIEEYSPGTSGGASEIADKLNKQQFDEHYAYGRKI
jgi:hypothetical protein